jgi:hypothetical protein
MPFAKASPRWNFEETFQKATNHRCGVTRSTPSSAAWPSPRRGLKLNKRSANNRYAAGGMLSPLKPAKPVLAGRVGAPLA